MKDIIFTMEAPTTYELTMQLCKALEEHWGEMYPNGEVKIKEIVETKLYYKIVNWSYGSEKVHAFVCKETGFLYKPESWNRPASGLRYDLGQGIPDVTNPCYLYRRYAKA